MAELRAKSRQSADSQDDVSSLSNDVINYLELNNKGKEPSRQCSDCQDDGDVSSLSNDVIIIHFGIHSGTRSQHHHTLQQQSINT